MPLQRIVLISQSLREIDGDEGGRGLQDNRQLWDKFRV
jgi:hypothetical protein